MEYTKEQQYTNQQIQNVQQILYDLDNNSIRILREYIESEELPEIMGFDTPNEIQALIDVDLIDIDFDYVSGSDDSLAFWYEYTTKFYIAIELLKGNILCEKE